MNYWHYSSQKHVTVCGPGCTLSLLKWDKIIYVPKSALEFKWTLGSISQNHQINLQSKNEKGRCRCENIEVEKSKNGFWKTSTMSFKEGLAYSEGL